MYLRTCKKCGLQYVGNTVTSFRLRFNNHKSAMMRIGKGQNGSKKFKNHAPPRVICMTVYLCVK